MVTDPIKLPWLLWLLTVVNKKVDKPASFLMATMVTYPINKLISQLTLLPENFTSSPPRSTEQALGSCLNPTTPSSFSPRGICVDYLLGYHGY